MEYVRLGSCGLSVSAICLGMNGFGDPAVVPWSLDVDAGRPIVRRAVESGITFFDTADAYSLGASEVVTGRLLREHFSRREDFVLATKVFLPMSDNPNDRGLSRRHILASIDASLTRLAVDYVDLFQIHRWDHHTPIEETMQALDDVVRSGKARYIGASSMWAWQFSKAQHTADLNGWTRFVSMQNHYNLLYREEEREMLPLLVDQGVASIPWSPLARGLLARAGADSASATVRAQTDPLIDERYGNSSQDVLASLADVATEHQVVATQVALAWIRRQPAVVAPIVGATKASYIDDAVGSLEVELSDDDIARLEEHYQPLPIAGHD